MEKKLAQQENVYFGAYLDKDPMTILTDELKKYTVSYEVKESDDGWTINLSKGKTDNNKQLMGCYFNDTVTFTPGKSYFKQKYKSAHSIEEVAESATNEPGLSFRDRMEQRRMDQKRTSKQSYSKPASKKSKPNKTKKPEIKRTKKKPESEDEDKMIIADDHTQKDKFIISSSDEEEEEVVNTVQMSEDEDDVKIEEMEEEDLVKSQPDDMDEDTAAEKEINMFDTPKTLTDMFGATNNKPVLLEGQKKRKKVDHMETINGRVHVKEIWVTDDDEEPAVTNAAPSVVHRIQDTKQSTVPIKTKQATLNSFFSKK